MPLPASPMQPSGGSPAAPTQTPIAGSPAISPSPNRGYEMAGKQKLAIAYKALEGALPLFGAGSDEGQTVLKAMQMIGKIAGPGDVSPAGEMSGLQNLMMRAAQGQREQQQLKQGAAAGGQPQAQAA